MQQNHLFPGAIHHFLLLGIPLFFIILIMMIIVLYYSMSFFYKPTNVDEQEKLIDMFLGKKGL